MVLGAAEMMVQQLRGWMFRAQHPVRTAHRCLITPDSQHLKPWPGLHETCMYLAAHREQTQAYTHTNKENHLLCVLWFRCMKFLMTTLIEDSWIFMYAKIVVMLLQWN